MTPGEMTKQLYMGITRTEAPETKTESVNTARLLMQIEAAGRDTERLIAKTVERLSPLDKYQWVVLDAVASAYRQGREEGIHVQEIRDYAYTVVDSSRIVKKMLRDKDQHVIVKHTDPEDARYKLVKATKEGLDLHLAIIGALQETARLEFLTWADEDLKRLEGFIRRIREQRRADQRQ